MGLLFMMLLSCASPSQQFTNSANKLNLVGWQLLGLEFEHKVYHNSYWGKSGLLHVYLDGDGRPFLRPYVVAVDPTPRNMLVLDLLAQDEGPALYLGRPCYQGLAQQSVCSSQLWTLRRYSPQVVNSMVAALRKLLSIHGYHEVALIGYSGGGALAMLIAEQLQETKAVVTIAGNLDTMAWTIWHGYTPLWGSLNPASRPPLPEHIVQLHLAGGRDENIPAPLIGAVIAKQPYAIFEIIADFDHVCCWSQTWLSVLNQLKILVQQR